MAGFLPRPEDEFVILGNKGTYKQVPLATFNDGLYAKVGGASYIRLYAGRETSIDTARIVRLETSEPLFADHYGRLFTQMQLGRRALSGEEKELLKGLKD